MNERKQRVVAFLSSLSLTSVLFVAVPLVLVGAGTAVVVAAATAPQSYSAPALDPAPVHLDPISAGRSSSSPAASSSSELSSPAPSAKSSSRPAAHSSPSSPPAAVPSSSSSPSSPAPLLQHRRPVKQLLEGVDRSVLSPLKQDLGLEGLVPAPLSSPAALLPAG